MSAPPTRIDNRLLRELIQAQSRATSEMETNNGFILDQLHRINRRHADSTKDYRGRLDDIDLRLRRIENIYFGPRWP
ncbi:hypothetical protein M407DRAFT_243079 [Tulasnella calospora MUT 4182]|uniref:Uncharacterized protein n=1 Tax=Tulasnella calospora MUT 4182 TaxID=1051891 RepID=A0A0C3QCA4_9AGAM|nr:hypothetical protein M407DRAFT_243079 [Tulasnella calospora MUT 4182]